MSKSLSFYLFICFFLITFLNIYSQNPEWINYTCGKDITSLAEEGNYLWVGTEGGLVKIDKTSGNPTFYNKANSDLPDNRVSVIVVDGSGNKWIGTCYGGLAVFDGTNWTVYNTSNSGLHHNKVASIAIDKSGTKWIGTNGLGLAVFDGTNWTVYNTSNSGLPGYRIYSISIDESETSGSGPRVMV